LKWFGWFFRDDTDLFRIRHPHRLLDPGGARAGGAARRACS